MYRIGHDHGNRGYYELQCAAMKAAIPTRKDLVRSDTECTNALVLEGNVIVTILGIYTR